MTKVLINPEKYVQDAGEMKKLGVYAEGYRTKALILIDEDGYRRIEKGIENSLAGIGCTFIFDYFHGEYLEYEIERLRGAMGKNTCSLVIGIDGGKILDIAKAVTHYEKTAVLVRLTITSTDTPCSALSVIYTDEGVFEGYFLLPASPNPVLMDTDIIARSPVRLTVAGIGDVLTTYFKTRVCEQNDAVSCANGKVTGAAMVLAKLCSETLMEEGMEAKLALEAGVCAPAVKEVIEANTLLSGIGFESAGLAGAHAIHNGLTVLEECYHTHHSEKVVFDTIAQLVLENVEVVELQEIVESCIEPGLPITLKELGVTEITKEEVMAVAKAAYAGSDTLHDMPLEVTPDKVYAVITVADAHGHYPPNESWYTPSKYMNYITDYSK